MNLKKISKTIHNTISDNIEISEEKGCIVLRGELDNWTDIVNAGLLAANKGYIGVINDIKLKGFVDSSAKKPIISDNILEGASPDVLIVGGGVVGCAIARELSKLKLDTLLVEKEYDVALGASSRNDGDVHVGIDLHKKQQKHYYNGRGNELYDDLCKELNVAFHRTGHLIIMYKPYERIIAEIIKLKGKALGIKGIKYMKYADLIKLEKGLPDWAVGGVYMPSGGEVSPYKLTVALAENAVQNGVKVCFDTIVTDMELEAGKIKSVLTNRGRVFPKLVINAAGVYADVIADMAGDRTFTIHPRKGTNLILDKKCKDYAFTSMNKSPFSKFPEEKNLSKDLKQHTKGGGVVHTVDNNVLIGPSAVETPYREDNTTDATTIDMIIEKQRKVAQKLSRGDIITYFSGIRAATYEEDFVVRKGLFTENVIEAAGIQSPGLTAAPAIAEDVALWTKEYLKAQSNPSYNPIRKAIPHLAEMSVEDRDSLIKSNPDYGVIICRCEEISKGEILDALNSPLPVYSLDAIKRRVRPGMGRCQGGFCSPLVMEILAKAKGVSIEEITKAGNGSNVLFGNVKDGGNGNDL